MSNNQLLVLIIILCGIILLVAALIHKTEMVLNGLLKCVLGLVGIYVVNRLFQNYSINIFVGMNFQTAIVVGILGLPGFLMLYGLAIYHYFLG